MEKKWKAGLYSGLPIFLFSVFIFWKSFDLPYLGSVGPGAGFFPVWLSGILIILSLFYMVEFRNKENSEEESMPKGEDLKKVLYIIGCLILFVIIISYLGFVLSSAIFLFLLLYRAYKWYLNLIISVGTSIFLFWLFRTLLSVTLPVNEFGW
ncbi:MULTISPECIES: tripartite tricarboxylate transporter TctB family protein [unclassified Paenibacillus]|uniref:tripartite tricarboxylate transporter TctB family protein n=1 Tax=unclassified Paenibacillus TaxID=185978 RepID=UPI001AE31BCF|nr:MULTISPECIES: tripartite tricarboxylate transporter TctB family protein [unclassified Paenibacillus]MBP1154473.1 hypothetical protein [Paenibacillus sp. PvP091]MBP1170143.1 hypothetical protein [Paenibacillus sp. PvR098]MBP2441171.1 hypothetical protein [Paenibacillus sp. PvP052]